jgi:hypothetical protein
LSSVFPLCERSAVNAKGEFNVDNVTKFEVEESQDSMAVDGEVDAALYTCVWELQKGFSNPPSLFERGSFNRLQFVYAINEANEQITEQV